MADGDDTPIWRLFVAGAITAAGAAAFWGIVQLVKRGSTPAPASRAEDELDAYLVSAQAVEVE